MRRAIRNLGRLFAVARILARHDALEALETLGIAPGLLWLARRLSRRRGQGRLGERLAAAAIDLGPSFIKLGQAFSTRADLIGEDVAGDLAFLRDRLPPFPTNEARAIIETVLEAPIETLFASFDDTPVAAASIAQVHFAVDTEGNEVAVKVLRPGIERAFQRDLDLFLWLAEWVERTQPAWRRLKPVATVQTFADMVAIEMDLRLEGAAAAELADTMRGDPDYHVPTVDWRRTGTRVLTTARVHGIPIDQRDALIAAGHDPHETMAKASRVFFNQVFRDGFFHGDPHPGNLFVGADGRINVVDFGIMGRLDTETRRYLAEMLIGFLQRDYRRVAEIHFRAGFVPADKSVGAFTLAVRAIGEPILDRPTNEISVGQLLGQLFRVTETFGMQTQPHLLLLQKVMVLAEGVGRELDPDANMWQLAQPLVEDWVMANLGPEARLRAAVAGTIEMAERLPGLARRGEEALERLAQLPIPESTPPRGLQTGLGWLALAVALAALVVALGF